MSSISITRRIEWDAAHRVLNHELKCATLHGHRYVALITVTAGKLDGCQRVVDYGVIKERVGGWVDTHWDHTTLLNEDDHALLALLRSEAQGYPMKPASHRPPYTFAGEPTAEVIASHLYARAVELLADTGVLVSAVEVFETPNCSATVVAGSHAAHMIHDSRGGGEAVKP